MKHIFLATSGRGVARAEPAANGAWAVDFLLADQKVLCLAGDPLNK